MYVNVLFVSTLDKDVKYEAKIIRMEMRERRDEKMDKVYDEGEETRPICRGSQKWQ